MNNTEIHQKVTRRLYRFITFICATVALGFTSLLFLAILLNSTQQDINQDPYLHDHNAVHKADQEKLDRIASLLEELDQ